jgi:hypothetical protein
VEAKAQVINSVDRIRCVAQPALVGEGGALSEGDGSWKVENK